MGSLLHFSSIPVHKKKNIITAFDDGLLNALSLVLLAATHFYVTLPKLCGITQSIFQFIAI